MYMQTSVKRKRPANSGTTNLFNNRFLEKLSRTSTSVPVTIFCIFAAGLLYWGIAYKGLLWWQSVVLFCTGFLLFTLIEYLTHRYFFHMVTSTTLREKLQYAFHGVHHDYPKDKSRLAMPPLASVTISIVLFLILEWVMGSYVFGFLPGFVLGYSAYLVVHHLVHAYPPPNNFLKVLWINHSIHHYRDHTNAYGVSSPLWDYIFGTMPKKK